eukprot:CAMPEP_0175087044 /NCGR_PEP_ID=MMETSP0052_2-20121109/29606_1 /TAXON_ID=51329 ORGANISM="Polytomella parva, Strain SAG 63-3" /NCGR_SAMPLE_ID=MMETSP0052_2 /ASSEMBLY_ACC=CAM_ASM_000194 /LENGTH=481 /DNA_ID=CAMNT_0016359335 /DNA_START=334 /DNA_END=1779 /DNA_ORIENTATION=+
MDDTNLESFNTDYMRKYRGTSRVALKPTTTQQVSEILKYCNSRVIAVNTQGGNTGLVGGSVPLFDEVVLSTRGMDKIVGFDDDGGSLVAQAGCVLENLDTYVQGRGWTMPLDLGAKGSCTIGGNVSTNAGGLRLLRYGSLHGSVLGLEAVLADGTIVDLLRTLRKDNTGIHLRNLFIGAEGSLGVVTACAVQCAPRPRSVQVALLACPSYKHVLETLSRARRDLAEILSAAEFLDLESMKMVTKYLPDNVVNPLSSSSSSSAAAASDSPFFMVIETHGSNETHDQEKMGAFLEDCMSLGAVTDGLLADSGRQASLVWRIREGITEALVRRGAVYKYDVSMPTAKMYELVEDIRSRLEAAGFRCDSGSDSAVHVLGYGHVGDGNLHLNVSAPKYDDRIQDLIEPYLYEWTGRHGGSVSAEHGLGQMKAEVIGYSKPEAAVALMAQIKASMDPKGILNPYKLLPQKALEEAYSKLNKADGATV